MPPIIGTQGNGTLRRVRVLLSDEPYLRQAVHHPYPDKEEWTVKVPAFGAPFAAVSPRSTTALRYRDGGPAGAAGCAAVGGTAGHLARSRLPRWGWKVKTGSRLSVNLDPPSVARRAKVPEA